MCDESDTAAWSPRATEGVVLLGLSLGRSAVALTSDYVLPDSTGTGLAMVNVAVPTLLLSATFVAPADDTARAAESRFKTVIYDDAIADLDLEVLTRDDLLEWRDRLLEGRGADR